MCTYVHTVGICFPFPPPNPMKYVCRKELMDEMVTKLLGYTPNPNEYGPCLTIIGAGGFGKTTIATALCHHPLVKAHFTDGFAFIELGPQPADPSSKLCQLYHLLTGQYLKQSDVNHAEIELNLITSHHCHNLLVIIDDMWHVEDAEPILRAFRGCKIVLTTRMNDIGKHVPTKEVIVVGPMTCTEATSLLIHEVIDNSQLSSEDMALLTEIYKDVHLWPLLLSLIRGQLAHNLKICGSHHDSIKNVNFNLQKEGLTTFDHNEKNSLRHALKVCLEVTLKLLTVDIMDKFKKLVLWNGIGASLQTKALHILWNISEDKSSAIVEVLWSYGLLRYTDIKLHPYNKAQHSVEVHAVISHFVIETMPMHEFKNMMLLIAFNSGSDIMSTILTKLFEEVHGIGDIGSLTTINYLKYILRETELCEMQSYLKQINMSTITFSPHAVILALQQMKHFLITSLGKTESLLSKEKAFDELITECHETTQNSHKWSRRLITKVQQCIAYRNFHHLPTFLKDFLQDFPITSVVIKAFSIVQECIAYFENNLPKKKSLMLLSEMLQVYLPCNHDITMLFIPYLKISIDKMEKISVALQKGSPHTEIIYCLITHRHYQLKRNKVYNDYRKKIEEIAPITFTIQHAGNNMKKTYKHIFILKIPKRVILTLMTYRGVSK